jgi:hypothetical protein
MRGAGMDFLDFSLLCHSLFTRSYGIYQPQDPRRRTQTTTISHTEIAEFLEQKRKLFFPDSSVSLANNVSGREKYSAQLPRLPASSCQPFAFYSSLSERSNSRSAIDSMFVE